MNLFFSIFLLLQPYVCMCVCMYIHVCMYACMYIHVCMYVCTCVCVYGIYIHLTNLLLFIVRFSNPLYIAWHNVKM